jgi:hypothetical protein
LRLHDHGASATVLGAGRARAQQKFFRIGTGGTGGTYYPIGGLIGNTISSDSIDVSAVATNGSVANVNGIVAGSMESGFSQADVNFWAFTGTGIYEVETTIGCVVGIVLAAALSSYGLAPIRGAERLLLVLATVLVISSSRVATLTGLALALPVLARQLMAARQTPAVAKAQPDSG